LPWRKPAAKLRQKIEWAEINELSELVRSRADYEDREGVMEELFCKVMSDIMGLQDMLQETHLEWHGTILGDIALEIHDGDH
jgi:hypothetical protein